MVLIQNVNKNNDPFLHVFSQNIVLSWLETIFMMGEMILAGANFLDGSSRLI